MQALNLNDFFKTIKNINGKIFDIPNCPNCESLIQQYDLEVLAIVEGYFKVAKLIDKYYSRSQSAHCASRKSMLDESMMQELMKEEKGRQEYENYI